MFGFGKVGGLNRREYNTRVRDYLEQKIRIETDNSRNPRFPGILMFAQFMDEGWYGKRSAEDTAALIALMYYEGCAKKGGEDAREASRIEEALNFFWIEHALEGRINGDRATEFTNIMNTVQLQYLRPYS